MRSPLAWPLVLLAVGACRPQTPAAAPTDASPVVASEDGVDEDPSAEATLAARADALAHRFIILDGHVDVPYRLEATKDAAGELTEDVANATEHGDFDYPRARAGGLDAPFMSIYIPAKYESKGAKKLADSLIDMVEGFAEAAPDKFALARSPADVRANFEAGKISLPMGMENGAPVEGKLANLAHFHARGIRYITLAHSKHNHISDSSYEEGAKHHGLSKFGKKVVAEMNRLGIMIDVAHVSDDAFWQVMELSKVPVIASHSSCRHFTPGWPRNMSDEMIQALARNGGVIQINFGSSFISDEVRKAREAQREAKQKMLADEHVEMGSPEAKKLIDEYDREHPAPYATIGQVADHIDHVVELVGVDHVGFGSDFDGVGDSLPEGLKSVADYPNLIAELLARGYSEVDIEKICSGNVLRVWQAVEDHAKNVSAATKAAGPGKE
jgi:membrane dipeptidase